MKFSVFQISRRGGREKNEDRMGYCYTRESGLFVLADGMGGHPEGEVAAQIALQTISALFQRQAKPQLKDVQEFLSGALLAAHHQILRYATEKGMIDTPRTTLVAAVLQAGTATWIHCGDSRLYMVRDGDLLTRTRDHSYMELRNTPPPGWSASTATCCSPAWARPPSLSTTSPGLCTWSRATACCCAQTACGAP